MMKNAKKKIIAFMLPGVAFFLTMSLILVTTVGIVAAPIAAVGSLFASIGDFFSSDSEPIVLMDEYFKTDKGIEELQFYQKEIDKETEITVPLNWVVIPNYLANKEANIESIKIQVNAAKNCVKEIKDNKEVTVCRLKSLEEYINKLRKISPYSSAFDGISNSTIISYIEHFKNLSSKGGNTGSGIDDEFRESLKDGEFLYPFRSLATISSTLGWRTYQYKGQWITDYHDAIDLAFPYPNNCGEPIYAVQGGTVIANDHGQPSSWGNFGKVEYKGDLTIEYWHMSNSFPYAVGTNIKVGDFIGYIGTTGQSTGCHLHLGFKYKGVVVDPEDYLEFRNVTVFPK